MYFCVIIQQISTGWIKKSLRTPFISNIRVVYSPLDIPQYMVIYIQNGHSFVRGYFMRLQSISGMSVVICHRLALAVVGTECDKSLSLNWMSGSISCHDALTDFTEW